MTHFFKSTYLPVVALLGVTLLSTGCGDDGRSRLRVVHASADAPNVDVLLESKTVLKDVAFKRESGYLSVSDGSRRVRVRPTGGTQDVIDAQVKLADRKDYTVIAVGPVASIEPLLLTDDNVPPSAGNVKLRLVHASPTAGPVDIYVTAPGDDINAATPTLTTVPFKAASEYLSVPASDYRVRITPAGTKTVAIDTGSLTLSAGQIRTGIAVDGPGGGLPLGVILLADLN
jgi:hypothetical protein